MTVSFPKSDGRAPALFEWADGLAATCAIHNHPKRLPHDLEHYIVEAQFRPPYGFWSLASRQAPFDSLHLVRGRWPRGKREWLDRVRRKHGAEMLKAEAVGLGPIHDPDLDLERYWPRRARLLRNAYSYTASNPFDHATRADFVEARERSLTLRAAWQRLPMGGALVVSWPPDTAPRIVQAYNPDAIALRAQRSHAKKPALHR
ncbi:MAG: hypothetical protein KY395_08765 [Actinobacteria bacterium]|nr:hypothetical protein [Actinomycetota bacterium]